ncbi:hypothetical protein PS943_03899 [Pseudomonas fluorescens]|jgi:hypothetical protein|uniref:Uncharacterized protein n=1 Tax=Pseudomonas fluorescens TaxID=294 RepID=A0A5E7WID1_PSEFL|nr:hypothetical protein PS943_03899 [Pseudomonas fluorescens]
MFGYLNNSESMLPIAKDEIFPCRLIHIFAGRIEPGCPGTSIIIR